jgi:hypothetical protein
MAKHRDTRTGDLFGHADGKQDIYDRIQRDHASDPQLRGARNRTTRELADEGMAQATDHADEVAPGWSETAGRLLEQFAKANETFMAEELRQWAHGEQGLPTPPDPRAWGSVIQRAARRKVIVRVGYRSTKVPPAHAKPMSVWRLADPQ